MIDDSGGYEVNLYKIETKPKLDRKKIFIIIMIILLILCICAVINNIAKVITGHKMYKQYESQMNSIKYQEEKLAEETERKKQEKIPKLTEERQK